MLIGAPNATNGTGKVYRYSVKNKEYKQLQPEHVETKELQWLGGSIATGDGSEFMVIRFRRLIPVIF